MEAMANAGGMGDWEMDPEAMRAWRRWVEASPSRYRRCRKPWRRSRLISRIPAPIKLAKQPAASEATQEKLGCRRSRNTSPSSARSCIGSMRARRSRTPKSGLGWKATTDAPGDTMRTWNVETACGEFLIAVPLWADVSPPVMGLDSAQHLRGRHGRTWDLRDGWRRQSHRVIYIAPDGTRPEMKRLGDPTSLRLTNRSSGAMNMQFTAGLDDDARAVAYSICHALLAL